MSITVQFDLKKINDIFPVNFDQDYIPRLQFNNNQLQRTFKVNKTEFNIIQEADNVFSNAINEYKSSDIQFLKNFLNDKTDIINNLNDLNKELYESYFDGNSLIDKVIEHVLNLQLRILYVSCKDVGDNMEKNDKYNQDLNQLIKIIEELIKLSDKNIKPNPTGTITNPRGGGNYNKIKPFHLNHSYFPKYAKYKLKYDNLKKIKNF